MSHNNQGLYDPPYNRQDAETGRGGRSGDLLKDTQTEIDAAQDELRRNAERVQARGVKVSQLQDQTANLAERSHDFRRKANTVRKNMWWKDMKMRLCIIIGIIILLVVIIVPSVVYSNKHH